MSDIESWKNVAGENLSPAPNGFPEGMPRNGVNNAAREVMASVRRMWDSPDWKNQVADETVAQVSPTSFVVQGFDATPYFYADKKVRLRSYSLDPAYAFVTSSAFDGTDTTVLVDSFDITGTPTPTGSVPSDLAGVDGYFIGGGVDNNHGVGRVAFSGNAAANYFVTPNSLDAAGISAAIVKASLSGGTVLLPTGTITLTSPILFLAASDNVRMIGSGVLQTILQVGSTLTNDAIDIEAGCRNIHIENVVIDGNYATQTSSPYPFTKGITLGSDVIGLRLKNMEVNNCRANAIHFGGVAAGGGEKYEDIFIEGVKISRCGDTGIFMNDTNSLNERIFISDVTIIGYADSRNSSSVDYPTNPCGISIAGIAQLDNITIDNSSWLYRGGSGVQYGNVGAAIRFRESSVTAGLGGRECTLTNFHISGSKISKGIDVGASNCVIDTGSYFASTSGVGAPFTVGSSAASTPVVGGSIRNFNSAPNNSGNYSSSKILGTTSFFTVSNCRLASHINYSIEIDGEDNSVTDCEFTFAPGNSARPFKIFNSSVRAVVDGCVIKGTTASSDAIVSGTNWVVSNCVFYGGGANTFGYVLTEQQDSEGGLISNNTFYNSIARSVIRMSNGSPINNGGTATIVDGNSFLNCTGNHIEVGHQRIITNNNSPKVNHEGIAGHSSVVSPALSGGVTKVSELPNPSNKLETTTYSTTDLFRMSFKLEFGTKFIADGVVVLYNGISGTSSDAEIFRSPNIYGVTLAQQGLTFEYTRVNNYPNGFYGGQSSTISVYIEGASGATAPVTGFTITSHQRVEDGFI